MTGTEPRPHTASDPRAEHASDTGSDRGSRTGPARTVTAAVRHFPWVHLGLGLTGNTLFVVGSVLFFWEAAKTAAIWCFVLGSLGMLLGSVGELLVRVEKRRRGDD